MSNERQRANNVLQRINELAAVSEDAHGITRTYGTKAFIEGRNKVEQWMKAAGLQTRIDNIGNIRARLLSKNTNAKTFVIGSHIDTIINAGRFDGPLGVLVGLDIIERLARSKTEVPFHIELVGFCDEEGCRFHTTYLGSKAMAGSFDSSVLDTKDAVGIYLKEVIAENGGNVNNLSKDALAKKEWLGYFEIHIEQGPVLYEKGIPVAFVKAIAGQRRVSLSFKGEAGHAGTVPMDMRKDAMACAAEFTLETEKFALSNKNKLVATIGKVQVTNAASNVIPGEVICSLDIRSEDKMFLSSSYDAIKSSGEAISKKRGIGLEWNLLQQSDPVTCDRELSNLLSQSIMETGYEPVGLVSGAGHDAVPVSGVSPVTMLFVKCLKGISHNPAEEVEPEDIAAAIKVSDTFIEKLISIHHS